MRIAVQSERCVVVVTLDVVSVSLPLNRDDRQTDR